MNAVLRPQDLALGPVLGPMSEADLDEVMRIERAVYDFPWTAGNFADSLRAGYWAQVLRAAPGGPMLGYFIAMAAADELHLLNLSVAPEAQGQGHARAMLDALCALAREGQLIELWLEVRESNARARSLYQRYGFRHIGVRRGYYPAAHRQREDALVMGLRLAPGAA